MKELNINFAKGLIGMFPLRNLFVALNERLENELTHIRFILSNN